MEKTTLHSLNETKRYAVDTLDHIVKEKSKEKATLLSLSGELGSGKTTFVQYLGKTLGVAEHITSPTFVILKNYLLENQPFKRFVHIDAYRLTKGEELLSLGWKQIINDPDNLVVIEWPEHVKEVLPENIHKILFEHISQNTRTITLQYA